MARRSETVPVVDDDIRLVALNVAVDTKGQWSVLAGKL